MLNKSPAVSLRTAEAALGPVPTTQLDGAGVFLDLPPPTPSARLQKVQDDRRALGG